VPSFTRQRFNSAIGELRRRDVNVRIKVQQDI
jgi:hypothetical protein